MIKQTEFRLSSKPRGFHLVTDEILSHIPQISNFKAGVLNLFIQHTSASLIINENADRSVRYDMESFFSDLADDKSFYTHTYEGEDDMPSHIKSSLLSSSITIPITDGELNLGTWQGIYLCEHRYHGGSRKIVATMIAE